MTTGNPRTPKTRALLALAVALALAPLTADGQDRLKTMPGYDQFQKMSREIPKAVRSGIVFSAEWKEGGQAIEYEHDGKKYRYDVAAKEKKVIGEAKGGAGGGRGFGRGGFGGRGQGRGGEGKGDAGKAEQGKGKGKAFVPRGRQADAAKAPDGKHLAYYRDRNLWVADAEGNNESPVTADGSETARIKYGTASWVYGEELAQRTAMWWSPDSTKLAYYRFDESKVPDFFLPVGQAGLQTKSSIEAYPKAGAPNPLVDLFVYDLEAKKAVQIDVRDGKSFEDSIVGHYVYRVAWSPDGKELLFNRTNRRQNIMEFAAADPATGKCRVIVREEWPASWVTNSPQMQYLKDNKRFIWTSERTGWRNLYLYDLTGQLVSTLTNHPFDVGSIVRVDEAAGLVWYLARSGDNPMKQQLHRVALDGTGDKRITHPALHHSVDIAPDGKHIVDVAQTHNTPPVTRLLDADGNEFTELATSDLTQFEKLGLKKAEMLKFKAADGETDLYGILHFPSNFDPAKKYPLLVNVYAGPNTNGASESWAGPNPMTEYGFLVARFDSRSAGGRGKKFLDAIYLKLGVTEIDDQAAGVKSLWDRPYMEKNRVGIYGTSYGGYASILCLLRHPDVFQAACASSPVTDYRHYDTIYTERYMWTPQENKEGYDAGSAMTYVNKLKGRLMLYFGTADNNVHPNNSLQLIRALQGAGKSFEVQLGPDAGHSGISQPRMMEFFIENLVMNQKPN